MFQEEFDPHWDDPSQDEDDDQFDEAHGAEDAAEGHYRNVPIDRIQPADYQARRSFTEESLDALAESIRLHGVLEPLLVRRANGAFELIAGERRLRAAERAELDAVPVRVLRATDAEAEIWSIVENMERENISAWEEAEGIAEIRARRLNRGEDASGTVIAELFGWSAAKCSERHTIAACITSQVMDRAGVTTADLCRLSKAVLLRAAQAGTVEARADLLRDAVRPRDEGSGGVTPKKARPPGTPAGNYSLKRAANGIVTIRVDPGRMGHEETRQAITEIRAILDMLEKRSRHFGDAAAA